MKFTTQRLYFLVASIGMLIALMVAFFGGLGRFLNLFEVSFVVHLTGLMLLSGFILIRREALFVGGTPLVFYLTGIIGALLTANDAYVVSAIGVTLAVAMSTLAQVTGSLVMDTLGIGQLSRVPFNWNRIGSLGLVLLGMAMMVFAP